MPLKRHEDREDLLYFDRLLAVDLGGRNRRERQRAMSELVGRNPNWRLPDSADLPEEESDLVDRVSDLVDIVVVDDPSEAARGLRRERLKASPIHALGFSWHQPMTATRPEDLGQEFEFAAIASGDHDKVIAVVDTGVVGHHDLPTWIDSSVIRGSADVEQLTGDDASHGTFVVSLLRQIAPTHIVSMARAASYGPDEPRSDAHPDPDPTTELHVAGAIQRLIERHRGRNAVVEALCLATGGPALDGAEMTALDAALAGWRDTFPGAPVFAAAGNSTAGDEIYPAASRYVRGVAAADHDGVQIVWDDNANETPWPPPDRDWVDDVAPGSALIGLGGRGAQDVVKWSGSSFATAVAVASYVNGGPLEVERGVSYWPNRAMRYDDVPGLSYA